MAHLDTQTTRQVFIKATETGFNGTTVTATPVNGSWLDVTGFNCLRFDVKYTRVAGTACNLQFQYTFDGGTTVYTMSGIGVSTVAGASTGTRAPYTDTFTSSSSANYDVKLNDVDYGGVVANQLPTLFRVVATITSGSTDTLTITGSKSYRP